MGGPVFFLDKFPGRLPLLCKRFRAMGGRPMVYKKVSQCHLYCRLGFDFESGQSNDFKIGIHSFSDVRRIFQ